MSSDLEALIERIGRGDVEAFAAFYDHTRARVYGVVARVVRDQGYSEDIAQEVYLQVWRTAHTFNPASGSALAWLVTLAHRRAVDRVRAEQAARRRDLEHGAPDVEPPDPVAESMLQREEYLQVTRCLDALTALQRECIELAYYRGLTYREVSERLSANLSTIKSRMRDGLHNLARCLGVQ